MDIIFTLVCDELDIPGDNLSLLLLSGRGRDLHEILSSAILNDEGKNPAKTADRTGHSKRCWRTSTDFPALWPGKAGFLIRAMEGQGRFQLKKIGSDAEAPESGGV